MTDGKFDLIGQVMTLEAAMKRRPSAEPIAPPPLAGLTANETAELAELGKAIRGDDEFLARCRDARWIELYLKHERAKVVEALKPADASHEPDVNNPLK